MGIGLAYVSCLQLLLQTPQQQGRRRALQQPKEAVVAAALDLSLTCSSCCCCQDKSPQQLLLTGFTAKSASVGAVFCRTAAAGAVDVCEMGVAQLCCRVGAACVA
jgi:hypothetical protein